MALSEGKIKMIRASLVLLYLILIAMMLSEHQNFKGYNFLSAFSFVEKISELIGKGDTTIWFIFCSQIQYDYTLYIFLYLFATGNSLFAYKVTKDKMLLLSFMMWFFLFFVSFLCYFVLVNFQGYCLLPMPYYLIFITLQFLHSSNLAIKIGMIGFHVLFLIAHFVTCFKVFNPNFLTKRRSR